jgi:signal transduction histidine kinase
VVENPSKRRLSGGSVRARTTTGAIVVVGVALSLASVALISIMARTMQHNIETAARLRADDVVASLEDGQPVETPAQNEDDVLIQVLDASGEVIAASPSLEGDPPLARLQPGESEVVDHAPVTDDDPFIVVAKGADGPGGSFTVLVGRNLDVVKETIWLVTRILLVGVPLLLIVVGFTTWAVVGRALAPVESMREEVAEISAAELHRRVPDPSGHDEIARLATTMNEMLTRLEASRKREQRLVSDASHELRNPIATIRHLVEVSLAHPDKTTMEELAAEVLAEDLRLQELAENLLLLARADEHTLELNSRPLDLDDLVLDEAKRLSQMTELRIDTTRVGAARTQGDKGQLQRVIRNLGDNAMRHASSIVRFGLRETNGQVSLEVEDDGPGVPAGSRDAIFERFARLDDARDRAHGGAGLGLAIVAEIVGAHGGRAAVGDSPLGGARFEIVLPRA